MSGQECFKTKTWSRTESDEMCFVEVDKSDDTVEHYIVRGSFILL
jgi:hypothetical protein